MNMKLGKLGRSWGSGRPGLRQSTESHRVRHNWGTEKQQQYISALLLEPHSFFLIPPEQASTEHRAEFTVLSSGFSPAFSYTWREGEGNGEGNDTPLQYSCLESPMDGGAWWAAVLGIMKSRTRLSDFTFTFHLHALEKEKATHSSVLAWRIPGTGEPGGLLSMGSHRVSHDWSNLAAAASSVCMSVLLSQFIPLSPNCVHTSVLYVWASIPALQIGSPVPFF